MRLMPSPAEAARTPQRIFSPIAANYDPPAQVLSLFQYRRWHRFLLSLVPDRPGNLILDMATGTGALALDLAGRAGTRIIGADITRPMLLRAQSRSADLEVDLSLVQCTGETPPFREGTFDAVVFAYLLRYVSDVPATLAALTRLLKPGGIIASLDFGVPRGGWYPLWRLYTDAVLPAAGRLFSRDWQRVGTFLGPSIRDFYRRWPLPDLLDAWREAGLAKVDYRRLSLGGSLAIWGRRAG